jgi:diacylglycerol kinase
MSALLASLRQAVRGILLAFRTESHMRLHVAALLLVAIIGFVLPLAAWQVVALVIVTSFVCVVELVNTSIERFMDMVKPQFHEAARDVKDVAAGAVLVAAISSVLVGIIIFGPYALFLIRHV